MDFFKSPLDTDLLSSLWNEYWMNTLMASPLVHNKDTANNTIGDIVEGLYDFKKEGSGMQKGGGRKDSCQTELDLEAFDPVNQQATNFVVNQSTQLMREFFKKFVFTGHLCESLGQQE
jgi:COP9 signalosome complex subunit 5